jgi:NitT/TauT family transport system permease protein
LTFVSRPADFALTEDQQLKADLIRREHKDRLTVLVMRVSLILLLILVWELSIRLGFAKELMIGQPSRIIHFLVSGIASGELLDDTAVTAIETLIGYSLGVVFGVSTGFAMWWFPKLGRTLDPYLIAINAIPMVALVPLFLVWLGLGVQTKIALSFKTVYLIMHLSTYASLRLTPTELINLARVFGATRTQLFWKIVFPSSLPSVLTAMKVCIGFALTGAVVGEYVAANKGLGYLTLYAAQLYEMSLVWAAIVILVILSLALFAAVSWLQNRFAGWSNSQ